MKHILLGLLILLTTSLSYGRGPNSVYGMLGFRSGAASFGAQFEHRLKASHGVAGYVLLASKDDKLGLPGVTSFGGVVPVHFGVNRWDLYVAPGFGYHMIKFATATPQPSDQNALGPLMKLGVFYRFTRQIAFGFELMQAYNWLNSDTSVGSSGSLSFMNLSAKYTF